MAEAGLAVRENNFDLLRLFGAALVVYGHSYALAGAVVPGFAATSVSTIGVKIFFSISGYLITLSWLRDPNLPRYLTRRIVRIFPALIVVVVLSAFVLGPALTRLPLIEYFRHPGTWRYLQNAGLYINYFLPGVFEANVYPNAVNGSLWSLPVEFAMYLATPLLLAIPGARRPRILAALAIAVIAFVIWRTQLARPSTQLVIYAIDVWAGVSLTPYFLAGMVLATFGERALNVYLALIALFILSVVQTSAPIKETLLIIILPYASLAFGVGPSLRVLPRGLDLSYGVFLFGFPVQQIISSAFGGPIDPWLLFLMAFSVSAALATLSWRFVEKPCLRLKPTERERSASPLASHLPQQLEATLAESRAAARSL